MNIHKQSTIGVIGAAGQTGVAVLKSLLSKGVQVRAVIRHESQKEKLPENIETIVANNSDWNALASTIEGLESIYYIPPVFSNQEVTFGKNVIAAAQKHNVRLVYHSVMHSNTPTMPHHWNKYQVEQLIKKSTIDKWTIVQPAMYSQTPLSFLNADKTRIIAGFDMNKTFTPIDLVDLGEAVANILISDRHHQKVYELAGNEKLTLSKMIEIIRQTTGKDIKPVRLPSLIVAIGAAVKLRTQAVLMIKAMFDHYNKNGFTGESKDLIGLIEREPTSFRQTVERELALYCIQ